MAFYQPLTEEAHTNIAMALLSWNAHIHRHRTDAQLFLSTSFVSTESCYAPNWTNQWECGHRTPHQLFICIILWWTSLIMDPKLTIPYSCMAGNQSPVAKDDNVQPSKLFVTWWVKDYFTSDRWHQSRCINSAH